MHKIDYTWPSKLVHIQANNGIGGNIVLSHSRWHTNIRLQRYTELLDLRDRSRTGITLPSWRWLDAVISVVRDDVSCNNVVQRGNRW